MSTITRSDAITRMCEAAVATEKATGCPAELLVAQAALESKWLQAAPGNNALGCKSYVGEFGRQLLKTQEWFTDEEAAVFAAADPLRSIQRVASEQTNGGRSLYAVTDWFATFPSLEACFAKRAQRWNAGADLPWVKAFNVNRDWAAMFAEMAKSYSTSDPHGYANALLARLKLPEVQAALAKARAPEIPT